MTNARDIFITEVACVMEAMPLVTNTQLNRS